MPRKPPQPKAATKPEFDVSPLDDDDEPFGGGIPDDDGMVYLRRSKPKPKGKPRGKGKTDKPA